MLNYSTSIPADDGIWGTGSLSTLDALRRGGFDANEAMLRLDGCGLDPFMLVAWLLQVHTHEFWIIDGDQFEAPKFNAAERLYMDGIWRENYTGRMPQADFLDAFYSKLTSHFYLHRRESTTIEHAPGIERAVEVSALMYQMFNWIGMQLPMLRVLHELGGQYNGKPVTSEQVRAIAARVERFGHGDELSPFDQWALDWIHQQIRSHVRAFCKREGLSTPARAENNLSNHRPFAGESLSM